MMQRRRRTEDIIQENRRLAGLDSLLTLGGGKAIGDLRREDVRREKLTNAAGVLIA
jgi:hypothetical protein